MSAPANRITFRLEGKSTRISAYSFLCVYKDTLSLLKSIDLSISKGEKKTIRWDVASASLNSPMLLSLEGESRAGGASTEEVIRLCVNGLRTIEMNRSKPAHFTDRSLETAKHLVSVLSNGIARVTFYSPVADDFSPTQRLAATVDEILGVADTYADFAVIEGRLEAVNIHSGYRCAVYDPLTNARIDCRFEPDELDNIKHYLGKRVSIRGEAKYRKNGEAVSISVRGIDVLDYETPQGIAEIPLDQYPRIDLTGGVESAEHIRRLRNDD